MGRPCDWSCRDHPPYPPFARGGKGRNEIGMKAQLVQDQLFTSSAPWTNRVGLILAIAWPIQCGLGMVVLS